MVLVALCITNTQEEEDATANCQVPTARRRHVRVRQARATSFLFPDCPSSPDLAVAGPTSLHPRCSLPVAPFSHGSTDVGPSHGSRLTGLDSGPLLLACCYCIINLGIVTVQYNMCFFRLHTFSNNTTIARFITAQPHHPLTALARP